jgi:hypothetical protein
MRSKRPSSSKNDKSWNPVAEATARRHDLRLIRVRSLSSSAFCTPTFCELRSSPWLCPATATEHMIGCLIPTHNYAPQPISGKSH